MIIFRKFLAGFLALILMFTQVGSALAYGQDRVAYAQEPVVEPVEAPNDPTDYFDLVAVIVDKDLQDDRTSYLGLRNRFPGDLTEDTVSERVLRYAEDIRQNNDLLDVKILSFDKEKDQVQDLAWALENLYRNGDGGDRNRLVGVVLVGDVPLPVVNKNGNSFVSVYPYTDFSDQLYVYSEESGRFERNESVTFPKSEVWHGVIRTASDDAVGREQIAEFFDKNHLYYSGEPEFSNFDRKVFFGDLIHEEEMVNSDLYQYYLNYVEEAGDLSYFRYNKFWAQEMQNSIVDEVPINTNHPDAAEFAANLGNDALAQVPDIATKQIVDTGMKKYYEIFSKYISDVNDWAASTGRYGVRDVDSIPTLITIKDEYTRVYLRSVNDAIEAKVNEIVEQIAEPLPIVESSTLTGYFDTPAGPLGDNNEVFNFPYTGISVPLHMAAAPGTEVVIRNHYYNEVLNKLYIKGIDAALLESANQCSVYLGSTKDEYFDENLNFNPLAVEGEYSILTRSMRTDDPRTVFGVPTVGVNTRLISPTEGFEVTGVAVAGALIEDGADGESAFSPNFFAQDYSNPLDGPLRRGDLIVNVNGAAISYAKTFEQAIDDVYKEAKAEAVRVNDWARGNLELGYYRGGELLNAEFSFFVHAGGLMTGTLRGRISDGAIFMLYDTRAPGSLHGGFNNQGYDLAAGCSVNAGGKNSDRCFSMLSLLPVMNAAGSTMPSKVTIPGEEGEQLRFPENVNRGNSGGNSALPADYDNHFDQFQFPEGYRFEDIDELYYDSCYAGLPGVPDLAFDSNPYLFPLDPSTQDARSSYEIDQDIYGSLLERYGNFVRSSAGVDSSISPDKSDTWHDIDELDAGDIVLHDAGGVQVTLKDFSDRYGLFDGIDNDGDGIRDYQWQDENGDGILEKVYDGEEAGFDYGLDSGNLNAINRKMLSHPGTYRVPAILTGFDDDIVLEVNPQVYQGKEISSMIVHNQPTDDTIAQQLEARTTFSLPIDDPRYVAFIAEPLDSIPYPAAAGLPDEQYYYPGETEKVIYPNAFRVTNFAQLEAEVREIADQIALTNGSYKILGLQNGLAEDASEADKAAFRLQIRNEVLEEYLLPVINGAIDDPVDGFELEVASTEKVFDALLWQAMNIDEKHAYVLEKYLSPEENAFVGDGTLFPAPFGFEAGLGYEAAYLVLDGEEDYFNLRFNKDVPEETDVRFDPLEIARENDLERREQELVEQEESGSNSSTGGYQFVALDEFLEEVNEFLEFFTEVPEFHDSCGYLVDIENVERNYVRRTNKPLDRLELELSKNTLEANSSDQVVVTVRGVDEDGDLVGPEENNRVVTLGLEETRGEDVLVSGSGERKTLVNGMTTFVLRTTDNSGEVNVSVESEGVGSETEEVVSTGSKLGILAYTYFVPNVDDEEFAEIAEVEGVEVGDDGVVEDGAGSEGGGDAADSGGGSDSDEDDVRGDGSDDTGDGLDDGSSEGSEDGGDSDEGDVLSEDETGDGLDLGEDSGEGDEGASESSGDGGDGVLPGERSSGSSDSGDDSASDIADVSLDREVKDVLNGRDEGGSDGEGRGRTVILESELVEGDDDVENEGVEESEGSESWEDYFLRVKYYEKFFDADLGYVDARRMIAQVLTDQGLENIACDGSGLCPFEDAATNQKSDYVVTAGNSMLADGESLMRLSILIEDEDGEPVSGSNRVKFSVDRAGMVSFENGDEVVIEDGRAEVYLKAGTRSGAVMVRAEVVDGVFPIAEQEVVLLAGEPTRIEIEADILDLVANGESRSKVRVVLKDRFGNRADNSFYPVAVFASERLGIDETADINREMVGTQLATVQGIAEVEVLAGEEVGDASLIVFLLDEDLQSALFEEDYQDVNFVGRIGNRAEFNLVDNASLSLNWSKENVVADGVDTIDLGIELVSGGQLLSQYNGPIEISLLDTSFGNFVRRPPSEMNGGTLHRANTRFVASTLAGEAQVLVKVPGFASEVISLDVVAGPVSQIELTSDQDEIYARGRSETVLEARLLDENGNLVEADNSTNVNFVATEATRNFVTFPEAASARALDGIAKVRVAGGDMSGRVNLIADAGELEGTLSLDVKRNVDKDEMGDYQPRVLYMSLLGSSFGNVVDGGNLAQEMLYSGQLQSVASVTEEAAGKKKLFVVGAEGEVVMLDGAVGTNVAAATDNFPYQEVVFSDGNFDKQLGSMFMVPNTDTQVVLDLEESEGNVVWVEKISEDFEVELADDEAVVRQGEAALAVVDRFGRIDLLDGDFDLRLASEAGFESEGLAFVIVRRNEVVAKVEMRQEFDKDVEIMEEEAAAFFPGVYVRPGNSESRFVFAQAFSGSSTADGMGAVLMDLENEIDPAMAPGFGNSLEDSRDTFGMGFEGSNKHMLLFAAGNSVGESHMPYSSEVGLIYGDPLVRLEVPEDRINNLSGFSLDLGKPIFSSNETIMDVIDFDYNGDGFDDVLLIYEDGLVRLLENGGSKRFRDRGYVLNMYGGIYSAAKLDIDNDGYDDLVVGTKESCKADEQCLSLIENDNGEFVRKSLNLDISGKAYAMESADMNLDGCTDLVISDSAGNVRVFNNRPFGEGCAGFAGDYVASENFGFEVDPERDMSSSLYVYYPGVALGDDQVAFTFTEENLNGSFGFANLASDARLGLQSRKQTVDVNGDYAQVGDEIEYIVTLVNSSNTNLDVMLSDLTPLSLRLVPESLECASCNEELAWVESGMSLRSHVIRGIDVPAGGQRVIKYKMVVESLPKVAFTLGNDLGDYPNQGDGLVDILVRPEFNPGGNLIYLYSDGGGYERFEYVPGDETAELLEDYFEEAGLPNIGGLLDTVGEVDTISSELTEEIDNLESSLHQDSDYDGCSDSWDDLLAGDNHDAAEAIANGIKDTTAFLRCSGSCLPIPYNYAFLAPNGPAPGFPILATGTPNPPFFAVGAPSTLPSTWRFYVSPTLTGGLGLASCAGLSTGHLSPCYAVGIPLVPQSACDRLLGPVNDAIAGASDYVSDIDLGVATVVSDGGGAASSGSDNVEVNRSYSDPDSPFTYNASANIRIPGFPSVVTDWLDNQTDEIYNKLLDFPDFFFIYPDVNSLMGEFDDSFDNFSSNTIASANDFLRAVNSIPMIQIEGKEILMRVPALPQSVIERYKRQAEAWIKFEREELERARRFWTCDESNEYKTFCDKLTVDMTELIDSVENMLEQLDQLATLPQQILTWRNLEAKYASQIVCYLDATMNFTGGYINRQQKIIESWLAAVERTIRIFRDWRLLLDLIVEYQVSCDHCKNDRFSQLGLLLQLFVVVPDPPVIPLPKWPDIIFDMSQIKSGVRIVWPDLVFKPEPIVLPDLPVLRLPDTLPDVEIEFDGFDFDLDLPTLVLPNLPDLPPLPLPQLPDLPRPPEIPGLPDIVAEIIANLKPVFTVLCLLKKGFIPVPEWGLATEIETLTQPNVQVVIPLLKSLAVQLPPIQFDYLEQIRVNAKLDLGINTDFLYLVVQQAADNSNERVKRFIDNVNDKLDIPLQEMVDAAIERAVEKLLEPVEEGIEDAIEDTGAETTGFELDLDSLRQDPIVMGLQENFDNLNKSLEEYTALLEENSGPDSYHLVATQTFLDPEDPILNRSIEEVERAIAFEDLPDTPEMRQLAALRGSLIDYTKGLQNNNQLLKEINDYDEFTRILVEGDQSTRPFASLGNDSFDFSGEPKTVKGSFLGAEVENLLLHDAEINTERLLAADVTVDRDELAAAGSSAANSPASPPGLFTIINGESQNILAYTRELGDDTKLVYSDSDRDGDKDLILVLGKDLYLKENFEERAQYRKGRVLSSSDVSDFAAEPSVQGLFTSDNGLTSSDISWQPVEGATSYDVLVRDGLNSGDARNFSTEETAISLDLGEGNYFVNVVALFGDERSLISDSTILAPQICNDEDAPLPVIDQQNFEVPIFKTVEIDASNSFDGDGEIAEYYLETLPYESDAATTRLPDLIWSDLNLARDDNGDGLPFNDRTNPRLKIGPFRQLGDIGVHEFILHVVDQSGNSSAQKISVEVFAPGIELDETIARTKVASGSVDPLLSEMPVTLMRRRFVQRVVDGELKLVPRLDKVVTEGVGADGKYYTDATGEYEIDDFDTEDMILVENAAGEIVAEINPESGNVGALLEGYEVIIEPAQPPLKPTTAHIVDRNGIILGSVYVIADPNIDAQVYKTEDLAEFGFAEFVGGKPGVHVFDYESDGFAIRRIAADDSHYPGGVEIFFGDKVVALIDASGNILILDDRFSLVRVENDHENLPLIIGLEFEGEIAAEIYISALRAGERAIVVGPNDVPSGPVRSPAAAVFYGNPEQGAIKDFFLDQYDFGDEGAERYILEDNNELVTFEGNLPADRRQFVKTLIKMLCIIPREEAYVAFDAGEGYSDLNVNDEDFEYIKEATLLGLVHGYQGEVNAQGEAPFKAEVTISRAEAVKVILEALELKGIVDLSDLQVGDPWYDPFMEAGQDLVPYLKPGTVISRNYIITEEEAAEPEKAMTLNELVEMVERVLEIHNCFEVDGDGDGLSDFCEARFGIEEPSLDEDGDGLANVYECKEGLDPTNVDSDGGGMIDGLEIKFSSNPFDPTDDPIDDDGDGLTNAAEIIVHKSDPQDPDTDDGGIDDGTEVNSFRDPLNAADDGQVITVREAENGVYIVPSECNSCPCNSTFLHKADIISGDIFFTIISNLAETDVFAKSEEIVIQ